MEKEFERAVGKAVIKTLNHIKENTPVNTGRLRNSIVLQQTPEGFVIGTNVKYAINVELGMKPTIIKPKDKKALYWPGAKHPVKQVKHPGFDGRLMFQKGAKFFEKALKEEISK